MTVFLCFSVFSNSESRHGQQLTSEEIAMELAKRLQVKNKNPNHLLEAASKCKNPM